MPLVVSNIDGSVEHTFVCKPLVENRKLYEALHRSLNRMWFCNDDEVYLSMIKQLRKEQDIGLTEKDLGGDRIVVGSRL